MKESHVVRLNNLYDCFLSFWILVGMKGNAFKTRKAAKDYSLLLLQAGFGPFWPEQIRGCSKNLQAAGTIIAIWMKCIFSSSLQEGHSHRFLLHKVPCFWFLLRKSRHIGVADSPWCLRQIPHQSRHSFSVCVCVCVHAYAHAQSCPVFCNPIDCISGWLSR